MGRSRYRACYFYPRPPQGGRRLDELDKRVGTLISIHALRKEGDRWKSGLMNR